MWTKFQKEWWNLKTISRDIAVSWNIYLTLNRPNVGSGYYMEESSL